MKRAHKSDRRSLWSALVRRLFDSHLWILQTPWTRDTSGLPYHHCQSIEVDYQSRPERTHSKGCRHFT